MRVQVGAQHPANSCGCRIVRGYPQLDSIGCDTGLFLVGLSFAGPAIVVASLAPSYDFFNYYTTLLITPMFIFSGVFYPVGTLPPVAQVLVNILPLSHAVALIRPMVAGVPLDKPGLHIGVLVGYAFLVTWLPRSFSSAPYHIGRIQGPKNCDPRPLSKNFCSVAQTMRQPYRLPVVLT